MIPTNIRGSDGRKTEHLRKRRRTEDVIVEAEENKTVKMGLNDDEEGQRNNGGELQLAGNWGFLNAVCKACRSAIPSVNWRTSSIWSTQTKSLSPWLLFLKKDDAMYNFVDPTHDKKYIVNLSELMLGAKINFSKGGWLLMSESEETVFFNPFIRAMIKLPDLPDEHTYCSISFSSLPTSSDCKVFAIAHCHNCCNHKIHVFIIARGDGSWKEYNFKNIEFISDTECIDFQHLYNLVFYGEAFYSLDCNGSIGVFDLEDTYRWKFLAKPKQLSSSIYRSFLVVCDGELLSVLLGPLGKWLRIFRLDFARMIFIEIKSLGKHMLFVCQLFCTSAFAPDSRMENKIFFPRFHGEGIVFYSLDTGRYHSLGGRHSAQDFYNTKEQIYCNWIEPNLLQVTDKELDWLRL